MPEIIKPSIVIGRKRTDNHAGPDVAPFLPAIDIIMTNVTGTAVNNTLVTANLYGVIGKTTALTKPRPVHAPYRIAISATIPSNFSKGLLFFMLLLQA